MGRRKHCNVVFKEEQISGEHCRIFFTLQGDFYVVTLLDLRFFDFSPIVAYIAQSSLARMGRT